jgi:hypothetical protein
MIVLDTKGRYGVAHSTPRMAWATKTGSSEAAGIER